MKGIFYTWEEFKALDPKQTVVIITYSSPNDPRLKEPFTRVLIGRWYSREEAWDWCKRNDVRWKTEYGKNQEIIQTGVRLLRLGKLIREYSDTQPKRVSALPAEKLTQISYL